MDIDAIFAATRSGLEHERLRLDAASRNIAGSNVPVAVGETATQLKVGFAGHLGTAAEEVPVDTRTVHDPGHPMADADGQVHYPATDLVHEMTTLMTASRGYEANVRAFNLLRGMVLRALEIGSK